MFEGKRRDSTLKTLNPSIRYIPIYYIRKSFHKQTWDPGKVRKPEVLQMKCCKYHGLLRDMQQQLNAPGRTAFYLNTQTLPKPPAVGLPPAL